jgi:myo-inositol-1(or 4)-monophosphatase
MSGLHARYEHLKHVTQEVAEYCLQGFGDLANVRVEDKGPADYVSEIDRQAEHLARTLIGRMFPHDAVMGEENGGAQAPAYWIIDPVDGTANFLSGLPLWAVSIAYIVDGVPVLGAIALPAMKMFLFGGVDRALESIGSMPSLEDRAPLVFGIGRNPGWETKHRQRVEEELEQQGFHVVTLGSCATSLAFVATGRLAGYIENHIHLWDCAAGHALCLAAGRNCEIVAEKGSGFVQVSAGSARQDA